MTFPAAILILASLFASSTGAAPVTGLQRDVVFDSYTPISGSAQLTQRLLAPLTALRLQSATLAAGGEPREQAIDLASEKFVLYVPAQEPPQGYALLVFVPPWEDARLPQQWINALDREGMIFVSAAKSGNDANVLDRREPLALLAAHNMRQRYRLDPERIYVGGFSGGSRVALRLALGYPDLFRGVLLNAGSDAIGDAQVPLPPAPLFHQFQQGTRIVYLTGGHDMEHLAQDTRSRHSLQDWCAFDIAVEKMPWGGHEIADPAALERALTALAAHEPRDTSKFDACNKRIEQQLAAQTGAIEKLIENGRTTRRAPRLMNSTPASADWPRHAASNSRCTTNPAKRFVPFRSEAMCANSRRPTPTGKFARYSVDSPLSRHNIDVTKHFCFAA